ncbi:MAG TPA: PAS domain S-box protein [Rudaea sp.]|nr:PAS domain S-box protein [Rudaea sp.]
MLKELFEIAPDAMILVDAGGRIVRANAQAERLFGYSRQDLLGASVDTLVPKNLRQAHAAHRAGYAANPQARPMGAGQELSGLKRNGQTFPAEIALSPVETPEGSLFVASIRDVSETQRARQAVARARHDACVARIGETALAAANMSAAIAGTAELIAQTLDVDAAVITIRALNRLKRSYVFDAHGVAPEVLDAMGWLPPADSQDPAAPVEAAIRIPGFSSHACVPLIDRGEVAGTVLVMGKADRTFDREALHFLQSVANLLAVAKQRIRVEEQVSHTQRLEALGQLTGGIAHDFNNLLTVISGNLQILEDELADRPAARDITASALRAVARGADLTRKLLAFGRRQRLAPRACDPHKLLDELGAMLRRTLGEGVQLTIDSADGVGAVFADPAQLDTALINLALNARDAMPRGGLLAIDAAEREVGADAASADLKPGRYVVFSVRDTGLGMAPAVLAHAFEPFFTTKEPGKGSGMGLSMVYGFAKQSGGHVHAESRLGYGTRFELYLPAAEADHTLAASAPAASPARGRETILVVEDEADVRHIAVAFLRSLGYTVLSATQADAALETLAARDDIALLFSDVVLGSGLSGAELAAEARRRHPALNVLLTSGYERAASAHTSDEFTLLPKPYRREELSLAVRAILDQS